jgi:multidrug efflux pump subunit AcrB
MGLLGIALGRPKFALFAVALAAALAVHVVLGATQSMFPRVDLSRIEIFVRSADLPPERMRDTVVRPIEAATGLLPSLRASRSRSTQDQAEIELDFDPKSAAREDLQRVNEALARARAELPAGLQITTIIESPSIEPVVSYALRSDSLSQARLQHALETHLTSVFSGTPGLDRVTVFGGAPLEYQVRLDARRLAAAHLTLHDVAMALAARNRTAAVGSFDRDNHRVVMMASSEASGASLGNLRVGKARLADLGDVSIADGTALQQASFDGRHAIILNAYALPSADSVTLGRAVEERVQRLVAGVPARVETVRYWDQTRLIEASQAALRDAILVGSLLALLVIYAFLRSFAMTAIAALIVPIAVAISIAVTAAGGVSLNLMTLGGVAIAVGLIIDEVIVVIEAIARELAAAPHAPRRDAILRATRRIAGPLLASTLANLVVFAPLALLSGIPGFFFRALALTLAIALVVSIALSLLVVPVMASATAKGQRPQPERLAWLESHYARILSWALGRRRAVYVGAGVVFVVAAILFGRLPSDFLPALEEGQFEIKYTLPAGTSLAATDAAAMRLERQVIADPDVRHEGRLTGIDTNGYLPTPPNAGTIRVALAPSARFDVVSARLRSSLTRLEPSVDFEFHQLLEDQINDLTGAPEAIQLGVFGPDQRKLTGIADGLAKRIASVPGVVDPFDGVIEDAQVIGVTPRAHGVDFITWAANLKAATTGLVVGTIAEGAGSLPVRLHLEGTAPLAAQAKLSRPEPASDVVESGGSRMLLVTAGIAGTNLSTVMDQVKAAVAHTPLPPGYSISIGGAYESQQASFREFAWVLAIAVTLVFAVLLATFNSFRLPLVILMTVPLSPIGVAAALVLTHTPLNVASFMGLLLLVGIVVRNGILLIDAANRRHLAGTTLRTALVGAGAERLRPILMTTLAAIGALLPLALGFGSGSEMERPLAIAVIGGLSTATAFTLVLIPVLYAAVMERANESRADSSALTAV